MKIVRLLHNYEKGRLISFKLKIDDKIVDCKIEIQFSAMIKCEYYSKNK